MNVATGLTLMGRRQAETLMESTCVITRRGEPTQNNDGSTTPNVTTIYTGQCRLRFPSIRAVQVLVEGQSIVHDKGILSLPVIGDSANVRAADVAVVTLSPTLDPGTTVTVRVETPFTQTHSTARRFPVEVTN
jgi:hypothetical protein